MVRGGGSKHRSTLEANVENYATVIQVDEVSKMFSPVIPSMQATTKSFFYTMPGRHATGVGNAALSGGIRGKGEDSKSWAQLLATPNSTLEEPGRLTRDLAETFLEFWGTNFDHKLELTEFDKWRNYEAMLGKRNLYKEQHKHHYGFGKQHGLQGVSAPVRRTVFENGKFVNICAIRGFNNDIFINQEHETLALKKFPSIENILNIIRNRRPTNKIQLHNYETELGRALDTIPQFDETARQLYISLISKASEQWQAGKISR